MREYEQIDMEDERGDFVKVPYSVIRKLQDAFGNRNMLFYYHGCKLGNGTDLLKIGIRELSQKTEVIIDDINFEEIRDFSGDTIMQL